MLKSLFTNLSQNLDLGNTQLLKGDEQKQIQKMSKQDLNNYLTKYKTFKKERFFAYLTFWFFVTLSFLTLVISLIASTPQLASLPVLKSLTPLQENISLSFYILLGFCFIFSLVQLLFVRKMRKELDTVILKMHSTVDNKKALMGAEEYNQYATGVFRLLVSYLMIEKRKFSKDIITSFILIFSSIFLLSGGLNIGKKIVIGDSANGQSQVEEVENEYGKLQEVSPLIEKDSQEMLKEIEQEK